jgi:hypothetical protein
VSEIQYGRTDGCMISAFAHTAFVTGIATTLRGRVAGRPDLGRAEQRASVASKSGLRAHGSGTPGTPPSRPR